MDHETSFGYVLYVRTDVTSQTSTGWLWVTVMTLFWCERQLWLLFFWPLYTGQIEIWQEAGWERGGPWEATTEGWKNYPSGGWRKNGIMVVGRCVRCVSWIKHIQFKVWPVSIQSYVCKPCCLWHVRLVVLRMAFVFANELLIYNSGWSVVIQCTWFRTAVLPPSLLFIKPKLLFSKCWVKKESWIFVHGCAWMGKSQVQ